MIAEPAGERALLSSRPVRHRVATARLVLTVFLGARDLRPALTVRPRLLRRWLPSPTSSWWFPSQHLAAEAGAEILRAGGNAIDAAVAIGYAEAVTNPCCGNIGGGGFLVAHLADGRDVFINFRETAPAGASPDMYLDANGAVMPGASLHGWRAVGVPGTVLGLDTALARYGTLPRSKVMAAAVRLARDGFILTRGDTDILARAAPRLRQNAAIAKIFLRPDGSPSARRPAGPA